MQVRASVMNSEQRNASEEQALQSLYQECRSLPAIIPPSRPASPRPAPPVNDPSVMSRADHERLVNEAMQPLKMDN